MIVQKDLVNFPVDPTAAMAPYLRVVLSEGYLVAAGAEDHDLGTLTERVLPGATVAAVEAPTLNGTVKMVADGAISQYARVYGAAGGKVSAAQNANYIGLALTAASDDGNIIEVMRLPRLDGTHVVSLPVNSELAAGLRVVLSGGYLVAAGAEQPEIGTLVDATTSEDTVASVVSPVVASMLHGSVNVVAAGPVTQYADVYGAADGKVSTTRNSHYIGVAVTAAAKDGDVIEVMRLPQRGRLDYVNTSDSAEVENVNTETAFNVSKTLDGAALKTGDVLHIVAAGTVVDNNSADTLTIKLYVGAQEIVATGAVDVADNDVWYIDAWVVVRDVGASGKLAACGVQALGVPGTVTAKPFSMAEAAEDLSDEVTVQVTATWSAKHADNEVKLDHLIVERIPA